MPRYVRYTIVILCVLLAPRTFAASFTVTDKAFFNSGAGAFIGEVVDVQVSSTTQSSESGTLQLQVQQVIAGSLSVQSVTFAYRRTLVPMDEESNWDLVEPLYVSLSNAAVGKKFLIFFTQNNGSYLLFPGSNAVQDANRGLLIGKIKKQDDQSMSESHELQIQVDEMIFGWIPGTEVTLPFDRHHACNQQTSNRRSIFNRDSFDDGWNFGDGSDHKNKEVIISFDETGVCGVKPASDKFLEELRVLDSQSD